MSFESRESSVFVCESVYVWYEMNYERLNCCFVEIEIQFMKIYIFWKLSSLSFFLCVVCFIFTTAMIVYILHVSRGFYIWCESQVNCWRNFILFYFICNFTKIFLLNLIWISIFWNTWWMYKFFIQIYYIIFMQ